MNAKKEYDLIVIGAGPAGLMAAGQAALCSRSTLLLEKMERPGCKLRITGKGRCNITNVIGREEFISHFGPNGVFLRQAFHRFFKDELITFFDSIGVSTVVERGGRVFPESGDAEALTEQLVMWAQRSGAVLRTHTAVQRILTTNSQVEGVETRRGEIIHASCVILATGGASYSSTGSSGDGYHIAEEIGHSIQSLRPALVPIRTRDSKVRKLQGLSLRNVRVDILANGEKTKEAFGEMMFTHFGLSGPVILTMSGTIVDLLNAGKRVEISIDLKPALDEKQLDDRLLREFDAHGKTHFQNILKELLPSKMIPVCITDVGIPAHKPCHQINQVERNRLRSWLKDLRFEVSGHLPLEAAMITQGGVALDEVDPRSMESLLVKGLFFAGEVLDLAADTGGFNLQAAFSTGWLAGRHACAP